MVHIACVGAKISCPEAMFRRCPCCCRRSRHVTEFRATVWPRVVRACTCLQELIALRRQWSHSNHCLFSSCVGLNVSESRCSAGGHGISMLSEAHRPDDAIKATDEPVAATEIATMSAVW